ncbi:MAG: Rossmann-like and DUF2520 domain-containing protein [Clostridiaceae bacterium]
MIKIGFIGAGKVGFSLGKYFISNDIALSGYYSKSVESAKEAATFTSTNFFNSLEEIIDCSDVIFITTPDDEIKNIWNSIKLLRIKDKIICHTSGCLSSQIFEHSQKAGAYPISIHPMFPICDKYDSYKSLNKAYFTFEGHQVALKTIEKIFKKLPNKTLRINAENKKLYHLANVTVSNLFIALASKAVEYMNICGIEENDAINALYPLMESNISNLLEKGVEKALTGPVERGDISTVQGHISAMPEGDVDFYKMLSREILSIAMRKNKNRDYNNLKEYLEG